MTEEDSPQKWAFKLTHILNTCFGHDHFPIDVSEIAKGFSQDLYPKDPIIRVQGDDISGLEGCLIKAPEPMKGWGIIYNDAVTSEGRINFTLAHEFGHYLQHRRKYPEGLRCGEEDLYRWDSEYGQVEHQANIFASNFLMPLDDYREHLLPGAKADLEQVSDMADRYGVSLTAAALRWIDYTEKPAILILSRDGFLLWAKSSSEAYRNGYFLRSKQQIIPVPNGSLTHELTKHGTQRLEGTHSKETRWGDWRCLEHCLLSDQYDFAMTILHIL
tara:strand:- start:1175 stop:1993 length:819 start_codon:yes stop_codon:yes gene_type:complete